MLKTHGLVAFLKGKYILKAPLDDLVANELSSMVDKARRRIERRKKKKDGQDTTQ